MLLATETLTLLSILKCASGDERNGLEDPLPVENHYRKVYRILIRGLRHRLHMHHSRVAPPIAHSLRH